MPDLERPGANYSSYVIEWYSNFIYMIPFIVFNIK